MPRQNELGDLRRSQLISMYGPGAIVDFRAGRSGGAPISAVIGGLDYWNEMAPPPGLMHPQRTYEPRLQELLGVSGFRLPPVSPQDRPGRSSGSSGFLAATRFPDWLQCPRCYHIKPSMDWSNDPGDPSRYCGVCTQGTRKVSVVPVRFIRACEKGHLDDFPWSVWVHRKLGCTNKTDLILKSTGGAGLASLILVCPECHQTRSMDGCFASDELKVLSCRARRPWLPIDDNDCDREPRVLQRGASNIFFPVQKSAIDIPPWSDEFQAKLGTIWGALSNAEPEERPVLIKAHNLPLVLGMTAEEILVEINDRMEKLKGSIGETIQFEEYRQLISTESVRVGEFETESDYPGEDSRPWLDQIVRIKRLREVRAIQGFTRIRPPSGSQESDEWCPIAVEQQDWLPAIEVRGEGIFLRLNERALNKWERANNVVERASTVNEALVEDIRGRYGEDAEPSEIVTPRFLLIHALSHALIRQLSLECGYSSASLRERLYVDQGDADMAGLLIYTASSDSDGTLGGLVRQGHPERIDNLLHNAIQALVWCSSDPLCIEGVRAFSEVLNPAACHSCLLAPETSCEHYNKLLDRAMLTGAPSDRSLGFFAEMI